MIFSNEILYLIFQHFTTRRYISNCALVCRSWYSIASDPVFYKTIHLYTLDQLESFMEMARTTERNNKPIGYFVKHLFLEFNDTMEELTMCQLQQCCPLISFIHYSPVDKNQTYKIVSQWEQLIHLPYWHQEKRSECIESLKSSLKQLTITLDKKDMKEIIERKMPNGFSLFKSLYHLNELSLHFEFKQNKNSRLFTIDQFFLDKIHLLCPTISSLAITGVNLRSANNNPHPILNNNYKPSYHPCQQLTTLSLKYVQFLDSYFFNYLSNKYTNLESLELIIIDHQYYHHHSTSIPSNTIINHLFDSDNDDDDDEEEADDDEDEEEGEENDEENEEMEEAHNEIEIEDIHRIRNDLKRNAIKNMFLHKLFHLKKLYVTFLDGENKKSEKLIDSYWPNVELLDWLHQHPYQYQDIQWPSTLFTISPHTNNMKQEHTMMMNLPHLIHPKPIEFLENLTTLSLVIIPSTWTTVQYILNSNNNDIMSTKKNILSSTLTNLKLRQKTQDFSNVELDVYDWLNIFPSLIRLELIGLLLKNNKTSYYLPPSPPLTSSSSSIPFHYPLNELIITKCRIHISGGLSSLCQRCPNLSILQCKNARYGFPPLLEEEKNQVLNHHQEEKSEEYYTILNAPWASFKELLFDNVIFYHLDEKIGRKGKFIWFDNFNIQTSVKSFKVTSSSPIVIKPNSTLYYHSTNLVYMNVILDSIDRFNYDDEWIIY